MRHLHTTTSIGSVCGLLALLGSCPFSDGTFGRQQLSVDLVSASVVEETTNNITIKAKLDSTFLTKGDFNKNVQKEYKNDSRDVEVATTIRYRSLESYTAAADSLLCRFFRFFGIEYFCNLDGGNLLTDSVGNRYGTFTGMVEYNDLDVFGYEIQYTRQGIYYKALVAGVLLCGNAIPIEPTFIEEGAIRWIQKNDINAELCVRNIDYILNQQEDDTSSWIIRYFVYGIQWEFPFEFVPV